jgi:hypothetical protein
MCISLVMGSTGGQVGQNPIARVVSVDLGAIGIREKDLPYTTFDTPDVGEARILRE